MYSIYVTNTSGRLAYVRLSSEKIQHSDSYVQKIREEILDKEGSESSGEYISFLSLGSFCLIPPGKTRAFSLENTAASIHVSVVCSSVVWVSNFPFDPKVYGCIAILSDIIENTRYFAVSPYNPDAEWFHARSDCELLSDFIKAGVGRNDDERLYFGRLPSLNGGIPCAVTSTRHRTGVWLVVDGSYSSGDILRNTGFELIRAKRGDPIPPNAVMTGVTEDGSLYVGRVGGSIPCYITSEDGKIKYFVYCLDQEKRVENGEIMVLTR